MLPIQTINFQLSRLHSQACARTHHSFTPNRYMLLFVAIILVTLTSVAVAAEKVAAETSELSGVKNDDKLFLRQVTDNIYAIVGPLGNRSARNFGNNASFGLVVTTAGVVLIDPGGTYKGAQRIHDVIKTVTDKPIKFVINSGGQDHRWLGNDYFKKLGAKVIASQEAVADQKSRLNDFFIGLENIVGKEGMQGTIESYADITFDQAYKFKLGETDIEIHHTAGGAHTPGDSFIWLPKQKVIFAGDIIYTQRILGLMSFSNSRHWLAAYETLAALQPQHIIPGHGEPTTLAVCDKDTYAYLKMLRDKVTDFMAAGGAIEDISQIDQSEFQYLENFDMLKGRNAQKVYQEIEFE